MRSFSSLSKFTGIILVIALVLIGGFNLTSVQAGAPAQATADAASATMAADAATVATMAATADMAAATMEAATMASTSASAMTYPPCPPAENATAAATQVVTAAATVAAAGTSDAVPTMAATANTNPGYLGIRAEQLADCGVLVVEIVPNSPAEKAQLQADDVIVALDGTATPAITLLRQGIQAKQPGDKAVLTVQRKGQQMDVTVTLGVVPTDTTATVEASGTSAADAAATAAATQ